MGCQSITDLFICIIYIQKMQALFKRTKRAKKKQAIIILEAEDVVRVGHSGVDIRLRVR